MAKFAHWVLCATVASAAAFASVSSALPPSDQVKPDPKPAPSASAHPAPAPAPTPSASSHPAPPPSASHPPAVGPTPPAAPTPSGTPCVNSDFKTELVRQACAVGGQKEAKEVMKAFVKDKKIKSCNQCHEKLAPRYELKPDGLEQYQKVGGK